MASVTDGLRVCYLVINGISVAKQVSEYDYDTWEASDYLDVILRTGLIVTETWSIKQNIDTRNEMKMKNKYTALLKKCDSKDSVAIEVTKDGQKRILEVKKEAIKAAIKKCDLQLQHKREKSRNLTAASTCLTIGKNLNEGQSIAGAVLDSSVLLNAGIFATSYGEDNNSKNLKRLGDCLQTGSVVKTLYENRAEIKNIVNAIWIKFRRAVSNANSAPTVPSDSTASSSDNRSRLVPPPRSREYNRIPDEHAENEIFSKYECHITLMPVRFPVRVRGELGQEPQYYELSELCKWVIDNGTNPLSRAEISLNDIYIDLDALREIQDEMERLGIPLQ